MLADAKAAGARRGESAGVDRAEGAEIVAVLEPAIGSLDAGGEFLERTARAEVDGAAGGRGGRAVDVGRAEADIDLLDDLRVEQLVGEQSIIAGVVERDAVERLRNAAVVEAANIEGSAGRAERVVVGEADARQVVDRLVDRLARRLALDELGVQRFAGLAGVGNFDARDIGSCACR
jgi:hypothetical protein